MRPLVIISFFSAALISNYPAYPNTFGKCLFSYRPPGDAVEEGVTAVYLAEFNTRKVTSLCRLENFEAIMAVPCREWRCVVIRGVSKVNGNDPVGLRVYLGAESTYYTFFDPLDRAYEEDYEMPYEAAGLMVLAVARTISGGEYVGTTDVSVYLSGRASQTLNLGERVLESIEYSRESDAIVYLKRGEEEPSRIFLNVRYFGGEIGDSLELPPEVKAEDALGTNIKLLYVE